MMYSASSEKSRCGWANTDLMMEYHDCEWGVPKHDERSLFEYLVLNGAQAGLSWRTILSRREAYRRVFCGFNPSIVASFGEEKIEEILKDPGIIRNRRKVNSAVKNAKAFIEVQQEFGSFDRYIWQFVDYKTVVNKWYSDEEIPAITDLAEVLSKDLIKRGFSFVGPTICYATMQAIGMVNDHIIHCFRYTEINNFNALHR